MVKIVSRRSLGMQLVYDIGVAADHNFVLADGLIAANCFNKSHSTAYGYVTFQTAFLKANYPVEYMAALLTANSGDQDKVQKYISTCVSMAIEVEPPDINRSGVDFTPVGDRILFGLSAVRNVGLGAIECLLAAREDGGPFKSLADLCDRIDARVVNRRALEALIHCGALDPLEPKQNRRQLAEDLPLVLDWAQSRAKDRASGQGNLLDLLGGGAAEETASFESAPKAPTTDDYAPQERLRLEKELLGFYVSDHPLKSVQRSVKVLAPVNLSDLDDYVDRGLVSAIAMLAEVKPVITKKGDPMAIVQLEDLSGQTEAVVFPKSYARIGQHILADARLMVWGKVDRRDDRTQFIIEDAEPIEDVKMVMVEIDPKTAADIQQQHRLREVLQGQQPAEEHGKIPVVAVITDQYRRQLVRLGPQFRVTDSEATVQALVNAGFQARSSSLVPA
ncbi:OB-fold nucleic acid binding domain-containing protein [Geitlerinema sp. PCC 7407]|uniref:helix-hairpin-helix domain-containing protein n=1 Tax=Geitlerinema sp. PCC 7407 TaxID=1173025 RepID=UPI00029F9C7D|nr:OB-fold nucleic acid binding domain-containing protein [Geitlerinema sp. PCC 7407]AFY64861.1 intein,DNA polymerase III, alpha subunit [Geitlerinema sp. PCC 7407]